METFANAMKKGGLRAAFAVLKWFGLWSFSGGSLADGR